MTPFVVAAVVSYVAGSIPFSYIAGRIFGGIDLREHGSGNLGASNTFRFLGAKVAVPVLVADVAKGFLPVYFAPAYAGDAPAIWLVLVAALFAVLGHMFSLFLKFRGGKGIATTAGAFLAIAPLALLAAFVVWVAVFAPTRIMSAGTLAGAIALPFIIIGLNYFDLAHYEWPVLALSAAITVIVIVKHRSNIRRLLAGEEPALRRHRGPA